MMMRGGADNGDDDGGDQASIGNVAGPVEAHGYRVWPTREPGTGSHALGKTPEKR